MRSFVTFDYSPPGMGTMIVWEIEVDLVNGIVCFVYDHGAEEYVEESDWERHAEDILNKAKEA